MNKPCMRYCVWCWLSLLLICFVLYIGNMNKMCVRYCVWCWLSLLLFCFVYRKHEQTVHEILCLVLVEFIIVWFCFRAPVLVALALMELGMKYEDAVELIRGYVLSQ